MVKILWDIYFIKDNHLLIKNVILLEILVIKFLIKNFVYFVKKNLIYVVKHLEYLCIVVIVFVQHVYICIFKIID